MVLPQEVEMTWCNLNKKYYENKGYIFTGYRNKFLVDILDLPEGSSKLIKVKCEYCGEIINKSYFDYNKWKKLNALDKDCCKKCIGEKIKESNQIIYGTNSTMQVPEHKATYYKAIQDKYNKDNISQIDEVKLHKIQTNLEHWGVEYILQNEEIKQKIFQTNIDKYGYKSPMQNENIKAKNLKTNLIRYGKSRYIHTDKGRKHIEENNMKKYGFTYYFKTDEFKIKFKNTCQERFGCDNPLQNEEIKQKSLNTMYKNQSGICSTQQKYIFNLLGGKLNYPVNYCMLDIAFPDELIYLEYDGSGHNLSVQLNTITQNQFNIKEIKRRYFLKSKKWKEIRIISRKDKLPSDEVIFLMTEFAKEYLNKGNSWIRFDIDNKIIYCSQFKIKCDFGKLSIIKK